MHEAAHRQPWHTRGSGRASWPRGALDSKKFIMHQREPARATPSKEAEAKSLPTTSFTADVCESQTCQEVHLGVSATHTVVCTVPSATSHGI